MKGSPVRVRPSALEKDAGNGPEVGLTACADHMERFLLGGAVAPPHAPSVPPRHRDPERIDERRRARSGVPTSADVADSNVPEVAQLAASVVGHRTGNVA